MAEFARLRVWDDLFLRDDPARENHRPRPTARRQSIRSHGVQSSGIAREKLSVFLHGAAVQFLISAQSQQFLTSVCGISSSEIIMHNLEERFELVGRLLRFRD